ncbi:alpha/beta-hydrolase [Periconia macrospinosa]|uniref:Alpha/beta-hydrolase n=1 Tax=Periconia macrospinosa TaxID=97972 RepID=A0A2V1DPR9_9PLEO|nr:alpha/beta-hydrolase [Periconia macrospinosa]
MALRGLKLFTLVLALAASTLCHSPNNATTNAISRELFFELEEQARIVDIAYCVGTAGLGIQKPFECASHCGDEDFKHFELVTAWNTGPLLSDSCGYIAVSHPPSPPRIILAFRGTYSIANTIVDLSTVPQEYVPYPGDDGDDDDNGAPSDFLAPKLGPLYGPSTKKLENTMGDKPDPPLADPPKCTNCTVHTGFYTSWLNTRKAILPDLTAAIEKYPDYKLVLVGHSLGGAVAAIAGLDLQARGWDPHVTTFGEPRIGNKELAAYVNARFNISDNTSESSFSATNKFHRVTHANDPVPLLPLEEWGYTMHSEEIFISADSLPYSQDDIRHCEGDEDPTCIADSDPSNPPGWGIPSRFKFWELFFAHRDYFWRIGLCVPGGDPTDWYRKYPKHGDDGDDGVQNTVDEL